MTAWYNENDAYAAGWLRNLIAERLIADGVVDTRSIVDVRSADLAGFEQCHFFAGIGGWSLALRRAGWPDTRSVWTGSCPCQPFSLLGKQAGYADPRHLWPTWARLIAERRPATIFGEQLATAPRWLRLVRGDLEALGYAVGSRLSRPHARVRSSFEIGIGSLHNKPAFWSTASSRDWKDTPGMSIKRERNCKRLDQLPRQVFNSEVVLWPTARASEAGPDFAKASRSATGPALPAIAASSISPSAELTDECAALNPDFVSWLMGFPPEWISCAPSATPSIPDQQPLSSAPPCNASEPNEWSELDRVGHQWGGLDAKRVSCETVSTE